MPTIHDPIAAAFLRRIDTDQDGIISQDEAKAAVDTDRKDGLSTQEKDSFETNAKKYGVCIETAKQVIALAQGMKFEVSVERESPPDGLPDWFDFSSLVIDECDCGFSFKDGKGNELSITMDDFTQNASFFETTGGSRFLDVTLDKKNSAFLIQALLAYLALEHSVSNEGAKTVKALVEELSA